jgi:hypothetical protein
MCGCVDFRYAFECTNLNFTVLEIEGKRVQYLLLESNQLMPQHFEFSAQETRVLL